MQFDLFRISLTERVQIDFEVYRNPDGSMPTREEWLRIVFSRQIDFVVRAVEYVYTPLQGEAGPLIHGRIGRKTVKVENLSPEEHFAEVERDSWQAADVAIDPTTHEDGQKLAMECKESVGTPRAILNGLAVFLNERDFQSPYGIEIGPISDPKSFWAFVAENEGQITTLTLEAPVPNMFGHKDDFDEEMRAYREQEKAQKVSITIKNPAGLNVHTPMVEKGVDYTAKTGGKIRARARNRKTYNSDKTAKRVPMPEFAANSRQGMLKWLKSIFSPGPET